MKPLEQTTDDGLDLETFTQYLSEIREQPAWRVAADRESDYYDGNQLDSDVMRRAQERGLPPAIEPLIGPTIDSVLGHEVMHRADFRVTPDGDKIDGDEIAEAINYRLNQAERHSKADQACSEAYKSQVTVGLGWVEVAREDDPFKYKYRACSIHRNEIFWDWLAKRPDLSDARYLVRRQWFDRKQAAMMFRDKRDLILNCGGGWHYTDPNLLSLDGGTMTDLANAAMVERGWSVEEQEWRDVHNKRVCLFEVWYRVWESALVMKVADGRVVEYDPNNPMHAQAIATGAIEIVDTVLPRVRLAWYLGPHKLADMPSPYTHRWFPYVPFWGKREDRTRKPYGLIRGMIYLQDEVNARIARMQWGLAATRTTRTEGAVMDDDAKFRDEVARPDADIVLDADAMRQGGVFKVERDFELNRQQYDRLVDAREGIKRTGGIYNSFMGQEGQALSGVAQAGLVEQSNKMIADMNDNFSDARAVVGEILVSMIIKDMGNKPQDVLIDGEGIRDDKLIHLNAPAIDPETGLEILDNDVQRTRLKISIDDVPSTPSYRAQQLGAMSEAFKSSPPEYQKIMMPYLFELMDVPRKREIIAAIKQLDSAGISHEQADQMIKEAVDRALKDAMIDLKQREIEQKQPLIEAQVKKTIAESVNKGVEGQFGAIQTAQTITAIPQTAPLADMLLKSAGYQDADLPPIIPNAAPVAGVMPANAGQPAQLDPAQVEAIQRQSPASAREIIGRRNSSPNFPANPTLPDNPAVGVNAGIEGGM